MNIAKLLEIYRTEGGNWGTYLRGPTSLTQARQEIFRSNIPISPFDMYATVTYAIVSLRHPRESPKWKFEETRRHLASGLDTITGYDTIPTPIEAPSVANHTDDWEIYYDDLEVLLGL